MEFWIEKCAMLKMKKMEKKAIEKKNNKIKKSSREKKVFENI